MKKMKEIFRSLAFSWLSSFWTVCLFTFILFIETNERSPSKKMFDSLMEAARNSTFKNPFAVQCAEAPSAQAPSSVSLVPGRNIAAAAVASGGNNQPSSMFSAKHFIRKNKPTNFPHFSLHRMLTKKCCFVHRHTHDHRLLWIRFTKILCPVRHWRCHLLRFHAHHGRTIGFG